MSAHDEIQALLATYETSLNTSDADLAAGCYTSDGMFMPTTAPTATGPDLLTAYRGIFDAVRLEVEFTVIELVVASDDLAYALTFSNGIQTVLATGASGPEANREVFVFRRETNLWKIARYMFNKAQ